MAEEQTSIVSSEDSSLTRQRKKRKWDQPADSLVTAGIVPLVGGVLTNPLSAVIQVPLTQQHANAIAQKLSLPKIQDELLIAREIVINDADSSVRYKLTKRQTQEEIQRCTGAVVITRGKYHPPNAPSDGDKPLYLHVSAGAHLKDTAERILAVDRATSMIEEMLKQVQSLQTLGSTLPPSTNGTKGSHALSTCVFLGFDPDPSLNISARVRGPSDQYINHIMNETGANVVLRGHGSGNIENPNVGEGQEQLHLFLSSSDSTSLDNAKRLAENLLDTISIECGVPRVSSSKVYSSVPPPQQVYCAVPPPSHLVVGANNYGSNIEASIGSATGLMTSSSRPPIFSQGAVSGQAQPLLSGGTSYSGYEGIYPQATALQQVALALRQSASPVSSASVLPSSAPITEPALSIGSNSEKDKRPLQRRKFQESPITSKDSAKPIQGSEFKRPSQPSADLSTRNKSNEMPPPPPRAMLPPSPPPKFTSSSPAEKGQEKNDAIIGKVKPNAVPDTLVKLMEYGDDDDDDEHVVNGDEAVGCNSVAARKPFWAL